LRASSLELSYQSGHCWAARAYQATTNYEAALDEFEDHEKRQGDSPVTTRANYMNLRKALEKDKIPGYWLKLLESVNDQKDQTPYWYAECHARAGHKAEALAGLKQAVELRDTVEDLLVDEFWDDYRDNPEFKT